MLAAKGDALLAALKAHRLVTAGKVRTVEPLPQLELDQLLKRYAADAPAYYVLPGALRVIDTETAILTFTIAAVVRNVAGAHEAFAGDGIDIGVDQLLQYAVRAIHAHAIGGVTWNLVRAEMEDDPLFDDAGIAAMSMTFESTPVELLADWDFEELDDFTTFHADIDLAPHAGDIEYASWLLSPPDYTQSRPDLQADVTLEGAS